MRPAYLTYLTYLIVALAALVLWSAGCEKTNQEPNQKPSPQSAASQGTSRDGDTVDADAIVETLEREDASEQARLDAIHTARDHDLQAAVPALRALLDSQDPDVVVASAAALEGLEAEDAAGDIVEAAARLSRAQKFEHLRQLLYIVGQAGGPEAQVYLETLAEGHQVPGIRLTADEVLERMEAD